MQLIAPTMEDNVTKNVKKKTLKKNVRKEIPANLTDLPRGVLTSELRRRGLVVVTFGPDDLKERKKTDGWGEERLKNWMKDNGDDLEDILSERGNEAIDSLLMIR